MQQNQNFNEDPNSSFDRILCQIDTNQLAAALQQTMQPHHNSQHAFGSNSQYGTEHLSGTNYHQPTSHGDTQNLYSVSTATMIQCKQSQDLKSLDSKAESTSFLNQSRSDVLGNSSNHVQRFESHPFEQENAGSNTSTDLTCSISKSGNQNSGEKRAYYQPKMPQVGEFELEDGFLELWYKKESFNIVPDNKDLPVLFENILCIPSSMRGELSPVLSFSIETFTRLDNTSMCSRVVLLNEKGERVLDTLVKVDDSMIAVKPGVKTQLKNLGKAKGPELKRVQQKVLELVKGRSLVGYHINMKLNHLGIFSKLIQQDPLITNRLLDLSVLFNKSTIEPQQQMKVLCKDHLNLTYSKRPFPYAHTEAKISMALYHKWAEMRATAAQTLRMQSAQANMQPSEMLSSVKNFNLNSFKNESLRIPNQSQDYVLKDHEELKSYESKHQTQGVPQTQKPSQQQNLQATLKALSQTTHNADPHLPLNKQTNSTMQISSTIQKGNPSVTSFTNMTSNVNNPQVVQLTGQALKRLIREEVENYLKLKLKSMIESLSI